MHSCRFNEDSLLIVYEVNNRINSIYYSVINIEGNIYKLYLYYTKDH